jgi:hypothetical protein
MRENGSQNLVTTGAVTGGRFIPTSSTVPTNGVYLPAANSVAISTNGTGRLFVDASGNVGVATAPTVKLEISRLGSAWSGSAPPAGTALFAHPGGGTSSSPAHITLGAGNAAPCAIYFSDGDSAFRGVVQYDHSVDALQLYTAGSERARIDSSGRLLVGTSTAFPARVGVTSITPQQQLAGNSATASSFIQGCASTTDTTAASHWFVKFASGTINDNTTVVVNNETLGNIYWSGSDGVNQTLAAQIIAQVDGTPGADDMPGRLVFSTTADGAASPTERMRITSAGNVGIGTSSPANLLHVQGDATFEANAGGQFAIRGSTNIQNRLNFGFETTNNYAWIQAVTAGTAYRPIALNPSGGNVGIGTASPATKLHVLDPTAVDVEVRAGNSASYMSMLVDSTGVGKLVAPGGTMTFTTSASERARIDTSGRLLVGTSTVYNTPSGNGGIRSPGLQRASATWADSTISSVFFGTDAGGGGTLSLARSNSATIGTQSVAANNDVVGAVFFSASDGTTQIRAAQVVAEVDGTPGANDMPGRLVFSTTADGAASPAERMRITSGGNVGIGTTSPGATLDVNGKLRLSSTEDNQLEWATGAQTWRSNVVSGGKWYLYDVTNAKFPLDVSANSTCKLDINTSHLAFTTNSSERARIDSNGKFLVGTSTSRGAFFNTGSGYDHQIQVESAFAASFVRNDATASGVYITLGKTRSASAGGITAVNSGDDLGSISFQGSDGSELVEAARIAVSVDGTPGANDMPGKIVLATTLDGASSPTEALRITNDRVICYNQPAPATYAAATTLTIADLKTAIITYTGAAATLTLPTGTLAEGGFSSIYTNMTFEWSVINTGSGTCTIGAGTGHTIVGGATIAAGASGRFASRRTAASTFVSYRLS